MDKHRFLLRAAGLVYLVTIVNQPVSAQSVMRMLESDSDWTCAVLRPHDYAGCAWRGVDSVIWALVAGVAVGRTLDRAHWMSDEVAGAAFGYAVGREVALRSFRRAHRAASGSSKGDDDDGPFVAPSSSGMNLGWRRAF